MNFKTLYTDLIIIRELFFTKKTHLLVIGAKETFQDEENKIFTFGLENEMLEKVCNNTSTKLVIVNFTNDLSDKVVKHPNVDGIIDFSQKKNNQPIGQAGKTFTSYYFFNNPDQSMRWIFPTKSQSPAFLNLYNGSGIKAMAFKTAAKILHQIGWIKPITSGQFSIFSKNKNSIARHLGDLKYDDLAIFTGTVGENRKAIIALTTDTRCTHFVKIPMTSTAENLVNNEFQQLQNISDFNLKYLDFPKVEKTETGVAVSNVQPSKYQKNSNFQAIHLHVLHQLYKQSIQTKMVSTLSMWKTIEDGIHFFPKIKKIENGLSIEKTRQLQKYCETVFSQIQSSELFKVGIGHGDFTPWNMYVGKNKLHLYDWEMCATDTPLLFDVFHYFFQKGILIERKNIAAIEKDIADILKLPEAQTILSTFQLDWKKYYQFYLLYMVCYYLPKYAVQPRLHMQVHWLLDTWLEALQLIIPVHFSPSSISV